MRTRIVAIVMLLLAGCIPTEPEFTESEQIPAEQREQQEQEAEGGGETAPGVLTFVAVDIDYSEAPDQAPAGDVTVEIVNEGAAVHNVVFEGFQGDEPLVEAEGGGSAEAQVTLEPGDYVYYCSVPGHREAGMEGQLVAE